MTKIEKLIKKILERMFPYAVSADVQLLNIEHTFDTIDDGSLQHLGIRSVKHSGVETLTIKFRRKTGNHDTDNRNFLG